MRIKQLRRILLAKTTVVVIILNILLIQMSGCSNNSSNTGTLTNLDKSSIPSNSTNSLSPIESEAKLNGINAWATSLNTREYYSEPYGETGHLYTTIANMAPEYVIQALNKGEAISIIYEYYYYVNMNGFKSKGEVQIKNLRCEVKELDLSVADKANGITWRGKMGLGYLTRWRSVGTVVNPLDLASASLPSDFSPWIDTVFDDNGFFSYDTNLDMVKQNGKWNTVFEEEGETTTNGSLGHEVRHEEIYYPLPSSAFGTSSYQYSDSPKPYMVLQTSPVPTTAIAVTTNPPNTKFITNLMASNDNLSVLFSVPSANNTSSPSYLKIGWVYGKELTVSNSTTNLYSVGNYTQTKDGAGNYPGQCVSFVKAMTDTSKLNTDSWKKGTRVIDGGIIPGTAIATFTLNNGTQYDPSGNSHAAIFKGYLADGSGFEVWDQNWDLTGIVGTHAIKIAGSSGNPNTFANNYYVIQVPSN